MNPLIRINRKDKLIMHIYKVFFYNLYLKYLNENKMNKRMFI